MREVPRWKPNGYGVMYFLRTGGIKAPSTIKIYVVEFPKFRLLFVSSNLLEANAVQSSQV